MRHAAAAAVRLNALAALSALNTHETQATFDAAPAPRA